MGCKSLSLLSQPPIARARVTPALRGHAARTGIFVILAMKRFINSAELYSAAAGKQPINF